MVETDGVDVVRPKAAQKVHLQPVDGLPTIEDVRDECTLSHTFLVPCERDNHPCVVVPDLHGLLARACPQRPSARTHAERPHHDGLRHRHKVGGDEEGAEKISACLVVTHHPSLVIENKRAPFAANPHRRVNGPLVHFVDSPEPIRVAVTVERPAHLHPLMPRADKSLHRFDRKNKAKRAQVLPHMLRHPVFLLHLNAHAGTSVTHASFLGEVSTRITIPRAP